MQWSLQILMYFLGDLLPAHPHERPLSACGSRCFTSKTCVSARLAEPRGSQALAQFGFLMGAFEYGASGNGCRAC